MAGKCYEGVFGEPLPRPSDERRPWTCAVCDGRKVVSPSFYGSLSEEGMGYPIDVMCRTCNGKGVVWR